MPILVECQECGKKFRAADDRDARLRRCPRCRGESRGAADAAEGREARDERPPGTRMFVAVLTTLLKQMLCRAYVGPDGLTFHELGAHNIFTGVDHARADGQRGWLSHLADTTKALVGLVVLLGAGALLVGMKFLAAGADPAKLAQADVFGIGLIVTVVILFIGVAVWFAAVQAERKVRRLDAMTAEERTKDATVVVTTDTVSDVSVVPATGSGREQFFAKLTFRHAKSGKWTFLLPTRNDARLAVKALTRLLGKQAVSVDVDL
jgi:hypothetical protein